MVLRTVMTVEDKAAFLSNLPLIRIKSPVKLH
ncbi:hypothetical protein SAMN05216339_101355 [Nitrosomonas eutropha]|uniref:Uncharacterized protein n=1 Tax=Nitrosomonas eutropha TaxID=916 RepID=A0A1I7F9B9_9PROT|nr:hypothetical protein SAMN05216339_101355 [Nitrosomonas eutropha]